MEALPKEVLFMIFRNLEPLELICLSRVNRCWYEVAVHPRLHRCIHVAFRQKQGISSAMICDYIRKFKYCLEELNLQECYWLKGGPLSSALQKCRKLTSLNVMGCDVSKKTICSVLKLNSNLRKLEWSVSYCDVHVSSAPSVAGGNFKKMLTYFYSGLAYAFSGLVCLTIRFPMVLKFADLLINFGMPFICSELCLEKFTLQWFEAEKNVIRCFEISIEGSGIQFQKNDFPNSTEPRPFTNLHGMVLNAVRPALEHGTLRTFLMPCDTFHSLCSSFERLKTKAFIVNLEVALCYLDIETLTSAVLSVHSLRYLNLRGILHIDGHSLQVIATSLPNLEVLNLQNCFCCLVPLQGLESLSVCCTQLTQLNLNGVHYEASTERPNSLMKIISKFTNLVSLSLCTCALGVTSEDKSIKSSVSNSLSNSLSSNSSCGPEAKWGGAQADDDRSPWHKLNSEESFDCLAKACSKLTEFELIKYSSSRGIGFAKSYYKKGTRDGPVNDVKCSSAKSKYHTLMAITNWRSLQRLTLAVPFYMQGNLESLVAVTQNCPNLQFLSLAVLSNLSHSGNVVLLQEALSYCHQLRDFRLEQPNFRITESFIVTLSELKHLERVCIIARQGTMKMYSHVVISLFDKCEKLFYFQVLCDITIKASEALVDALTRRFARVRPGLVVSVFPYRQASARLDPNLVKSIPVVHLKELFLFGTAVATRVPV